MTNTTDKNSNETRSGAEAQIKIEQAPTNTNPNDPQTSLQTFEVMFVLTQRSSGAVLIQAASADEARRKAGQLDLCDVANWEIFEDQMDIESVDLAGEGQDDE